MQRWHLKSLVADGTIRQDTIEATSREEAIALAAARDLIPFDAVPTKSSGREKKVIRPSDRTALIRDMAAMVAANVPLPETLATIAKSGTKPSIRNAANLLGQALRTGASLSEAMRQQLAIPVEVSVAVAAGERAGDLAGTLQRISKTLHRREEIRKALIGALIYPTILLIVTVVSLGVLLVGVIPGLAPLIKGAGGAAPQSALLLIGLSDLLIGFGAETGTLAVCALIIAVWLGRSQKIRQASQEYGMRAPVIGRLARAAGTANALRTVSVLLNGGTTLPDAVELAARATPVKSMSAALSSVAKQVREGVDLAAAFAAPPALDTSVAGLVALGLRNGRLAEMLDSAALVLERDVDAGAKRIVALLPPVMTLLLGCIVGGVSMVILNGILSINNVAI